MSRVRTPKGGGEKVSEATRHSENQAISRYIKAGAFFRRVTRPNPYKFPQASTRLKCFFPWPKWLSNVMPQLSSSLLSTLSYQPVRNSARPASDQIRPQAFPSIHPSIHYSNNPSPGRAIMVNQAVSSQVSANPGEVLFQVHSFGPLVD